ncbi:MAG: protein-tyrosine-phosphatase, partial [Ginsengibacter sp.]
MHLFPKIEAFIDSLQEESIPENRKILLAPLITYIQNKMSKKEPVQLNFICTHNSRRSHLAQVWAQTMASWYSLPNIYCFSAGTEETAMYPMVAETLRETGFNVQTNSQKQNPVYHIFFSENVGPVIAFSKKLDSEFNPKNTFSAVMVCSQADESCPNILGADNRIALDYEDPKLFDNTSEQREKYLER